jgi:glycosyltransferase involved in cell wall biosynthesis
MKIIYILSSATKYGGASKSFLNMLRGLIIEKNIEPVVILPEYGALCEILQNDKIPFKVLPYYFSIYPRLRKGKVLQYRILFVPHLFVKIFFNIIAIIRLIKFIKKRKPDIIHSNVGPIHIGFHVARILKIPHIWHLREYQLLDFNMHPFPSMNNFKKKLQSKNNHCIAITKNIFNYFSLNGNAKIIYNGVLSCENKVFIPQKEKYFLFAGRTTPNKGIGNLILAFTEVVKFNNEYKLYIAGDTNDKEYKNTIYKLVEKNNLKDKIIFLGMRDDIYNLMSKATALIVPSLFEGFGRITAEAMINGCLVIGYNTAGTKEILESENLGILYLSDEELIKIMIEITDKGIENYYSKILKAQDRAVSLYSIEQNVNAIYELYMETLNIND